MIRKITKKRKSMLFFKKSEVNCNKGSVFFNCFVQPNEKKRKRRRKELLPKPVKVKSEQPKVVREHKNVMNY